MNLHEYQGKILLKKCGVPVPVGHVAFTPDEAVEAARQISLKTGVTSFAVKAQIHAGGRGKGGGVKIAKSIEEVKAYAKQILGMTLVTHQTGPEGKVVQKILVEQSIYYPNSEGKVDVAEYYMAFLLNRSTGKNIVMYSPSGGMDIEKVAEVTPNLIFHEEIDPGSGLMPYQARRIAFNLGLTEEVHKNMVKFVSALYKAYLQSDSTMLEINPVFKTSDNQILAADCKVKLDDNSLFRQKEFTQMRDLSEEEPSEVEASHYSLNFVKLNGNVGCMVNGAGLAMATMDIIKLSGGNPANFLDVGGSANAEKVEAGFRIILQDKNVRAILLNVFGGIVRCDRVAQGVVDAYNKIGDITIPVIVRLQGTNAKEGKELIDNSGLKVHSATTLQEAADLVKSMVE
jgi:succinyl-CoA synthetase beta subunit